MIQRLIDIILTSIAVVFLAPLFLMVIFVLRFTGEGQIFFPQQRVGRKKTLISVLKFATMLKNSPNMKLGTVTIKDDPRVLPVGRILRKTKINELPQLFNVFIGDMSLVGPRPLTKQTFDFYSTNAKDTIAMVRPGLSGIGSIVFRNEERLLSEAEQSIDFYAKNIAKYKGDLEIWFVENLSLKIYFQVILTTIFVVVFPNSNIHWKIFPTLPKPPEALRLKLGFVD